MFHLGSFLDKLVLIDGYWRIIWIALGVKTAKSNIIASALV